MEEKQLNISKSHLEAAHNTSNRTWLEQTFDQARQVIEAGGRVKITQEFSDASKELVALIDNIKTLEHYKRTYMG